MNLYKKIYSPNVLLGYPTACLFAFWEAKMKKQAYFISFGFWRDTAEIWTF